MIRTITLSLTILLLLVSSGFAQTRDTSVTAENEKIHSRAKRYSGLNKRVVVVTRTGEKFKGRVTSFDDERFTLEQSGTGQTLTFQYNGVKKLHKSGGLSAGAIVAIGGAATAAAILLGMYVKYCKNEGGC